jgi:hypothetical protein
MRVLAIVAMVGCTGVRPVAPAPRDRARTAALDGAVVAVPGETMEFRVSLRGVKVGLVQTAVGWPGVIGERPALIICSRGKTEGVLSLIGDLTWELSSTIDTARGVPIEDHEEAWAELAGDKHHENHRRRWDADDALHDIHSAVGAVRGRRSKPGDSTAFEVEIGGAHLDVALAHTGRAFAVHQPAIRYDGLVEGEIPFPPGCRTMRRACRCGWSRSRGGARSRWSSWTIKYLRTTDRGIA